jgi:LuxR family maltose regulon positive regulatory protein
LDLMAYLIECDFVGAEAKLATIKFKFRDTQDQIYVDEATSLARAHIDFAFGRFKELEISANDFLKNHENVPNLEEGEFLDTLRLLAQKHLIMDENEELANVYKEVTRYKKDHTDTNLFYMANSVYAMLLLSQGEYFKALEVANNNIEIAKQNNYMGLMAPIDCMYVAASSLFALARNQESLEAFQEISELALKLNLWPWFFIADGLICRDFAHKGKMPEALAMIRDERTKLLDVNFRHELDFMPDVNELYVRFLISDFDRMEVLLGRVPELLIVNQIRAFFYELKGKDMLKFYENLPERTPREKLYKLLGLADYYKDKESIAVEYMRQALEVVEQTGSIELILRQYDLATITLKAISKSPTVLLENLASRLAERIKLKFANNKEGLPVPLTKRELEVVRQLSTGKPISSISNSLHVSMNTMKTHLRNVYRKLEVDGRERAVERARELLLI